MSSKKKRKKKFQFEYIQKEIITTINNDLPLPLIKSISRIPENHPSRGGKHVLTWKEKKKNYIALENLSSR